MGFSAKALLPMVRTPAGITTMAGRFGSVNLPWNTPSPMATTFTPSSCWGTLMGVMPSLAPFQAMIVASVFSGFST